MGAAGRLLSLGALKESRGVGLGCAGKMGGGHVWTKAADRGSSLLSSLSPLCFSLALIASPSAELCLPKEAFDFWIYDIGFIIPQKGCHLFMGGPLSGKSLGSVGSWGCDLH